MSGSGQSAFDLKAFSLRNRRRSEAASGFNHSLGAWSASEWMVAAVGELGEACGVLKEVLRLRDGVPNKGFTQDDLQLMLAHELADTVIYIDLLAQAMGIDLAEAIEAKFSLTSAKIGYVE